MTGLGIRPCTEAFCARLQTLDGSVEEATQCLSRDGERWSWQRSLVEEVNAAQHEVVQFDVGGERFHTTHSVLSRHPDSTLSVLLTKRTQDENVVVMDENYVFIDRNPQHFPLVMEYLRGGYCHVPEDLESRNSLLADATYYGLDGLRQQLERKLFDQKMAELEQLERALERERSERADEQQKHYEHEQRIQQLLMERGGAPRSGTPPHNGDRTPTDRSTPTPLPTGSSPRTSDDVSSPIPRITESFLSRTSGEASPRSLPSPRLTMTTATLLHHRRTAPTLPPPPPQTPPSPIPPPETPPRIPTALPSQTPPSPIPLPQTPPPATPPPPPSSFPQPPLTPSQPLSPRLPHTPPRLPQTPPSKLQLPQSTGSRFSVDSLEDFEKNVEAARAETARWVAYRAERERSRREAPSTPGAGALAPGGPAGPLLASPMIPEKEAALAAVAAVTAMEHEVSNNTSSNSGTNREEAGPSEEFSERIRQHRKTANDLERMFQNSMFYQPPPRANVQSPPRGRGDDVETDSGLSSELWSPGVVDEYDTQRRMSSSDPNEASFTVTSFEASVVKRWQRHFTDDP